MTRLDNVSAPLKNFSEYEQIIELLFVCQLSTLKECFNGNSDEE